jgi:para-nitrobenzyl esterase
MLAANDLGRKARDRERVGMYLWAKRRIETHRSPVFTYFFDRGIPWPQHPEFGAFHSGELPYFFANFDGLDRPWEAIDRRLTETASGYLKHFAMNGDPNDDDLPKWRAVDPSSPETQEIGERVQAMPLAQKPKYDFWVRYLTSPEVPKAPVF